MHGDYDTREMDRELEDIVSQMHKEKLSDWRAQTVKMVAFIGMCVVMTISLVIAIEVLIF